MKRSILSILAVIGIIALAGGYYGYQLLYAPNVKLSVEHEYFLIKSTDTYNEVYEHLKHKLRKPNNFQLLATRKGLITKIKPGRYKLVNGMSTNTLVNMLKSGRQEHVKATFNSEVYSLGQLAEKLSRNIELDSAQLAEYLMQDSVWQRYGYEGHTFMSMFIPDTYFVNWNISAEKLVERLHKEHEKFWKGQEDKLKALGLTQLQVSIIASIVQSETTKIDDAPIIAGVYLNRLKINMPLQADPTVKFAIGKPLIRRVLHSDLSVDSPYNTYKYAGLPPGPICLPSIANLKAVLNYQKHDYLYFCAKEDFSGYSNFASTLEQHNVNARRYQQALNRRGTYR